MWYKNDGIGRMVFEKEVTMGHSEDYIRNKMYELEKQKVEIEHNKVLALIDIRDALISVSTTMIGELELKSKTPYEDGVYKVCKESLSNTLDKINARWNDVYN